MSNEVRLIVTKTKNSLSWLYMCIFPLPIVDKSAFESYIIKNSLYAQAHMLGFYLPDFSVEYHQVT